MRLLNLCIERRTNRRILIQFGAVLESFIEFKELRLEHAQAMEFGEQVSSSIRRRPHRVVRVTFLPLRKNSMSAIKIQVVEKLKPVIERWCREHRISSKSRERQGSNRRRYH